jgi:outer membrane protein assembly factor BamB
MQGRSLITLVVMAAAMIVPRQALAQAVDVPLDVVMPIEFDPSRDVDRPQTVSLPIDFERQSQLKHVRSLLNSDERVLAVHQLGTLLNQCDRDTFVRSGSDFIGFRRQVMQLILQLPPGAKTMYVAEFEPEAALALASAHDSSPGSFVRVANRFPGTPSGQSALLLQAMIELDRGRNSMAIEYLRRLQVHSTDGVLPATARPLVDVCQQDRPMSLHAPEPVLRPKWVATEPDNSGRSLRSTSATRDRKTAPGRLKLVESWSESLTAHPNNTEDTRLDEHERINANMPLIPAMRPLLIGSALIVESAGRLMVFDVGRGVLRYSIKLDQPHTTQFAQDGAGELLAADDKQMLVVQRYESDHRTSPNQFAKQIRKLEPLVFPVWPPDTYMNTPIPAVSSKVVAYDLQTGNVRWSAGGLDESRDCLRDATICGTPVIDGDEVFLIVEARSTLRLIVLDADDGRLLWTQQIGWADRSINDDLDRLAADCRPLVDNDLILCPTSAGKLVAVNRATRSLQWAFEYRTSALMPFEHHLVANSDEPMWGGWLGKHLHQTDNFIVLSAPDSSQLLCIDRESGRQRWSQPQNDAWYVAHVDNQQVWTVGAHTVQRRNISNGAAVDKPLMVASEVTGIGVFHRGEYLLPTRDRLMRFDFESASQVGEFHPESTGVHGNLASGGDRLIDMSSTGVEVFHTYDDR